MRAVRAIAGVSLRRAARDRRALFFTLALPVVVILVVGLTVPSRRSLPIGVVGGSTSAAARDLTATLEASPSLEVEAFPSVAAAETAVRRSEIDAAVVVPADLERQLRGGAPVHVGVLAEAANPTQQAAAVSVRAAVDRFAARVQAARFAAARTGRSFDESLAVATRLQPSAAAVPVRTVVADATEATLPGGFSYSAPTMLVLFVFINALAAGAVMIGTRRLGLYERILAAPVSAGAVVAGELLAAFALALAQAVLIVVVGSLAFGVSWGDPLAAGILVVLWALVGAGAGVLAGSLFRTPEQATAVGPAVGIALGMLGGCMWPLSIVSETMRSVGHLTPHAWAVDAWTMLIARHAGLLEVGPKLAVLVAFGAGMVALAAVRFRRRLA